MTSFNNITREFSSFRDPAGQVFRDEQGVLMRRVNKIYFEQYNALMSSGLYDELIKFNALINHKELERNQDYILIQPEEIPFVSYPYEWSFGELKDAALLTLKIHRRALTHNLILKDASAYNIQFMNGRPVLIDSLSFDFYHEGEAWGAYGQFCRHFLAPLLLMANKDIRLNKLLSLFIDGVPLDLADKLLNLNIFNFFAWQHIKLHAKSIAKHESDNRHSENNKNLNIKISRKSHLALINSLIRGIENLKLKNIMTEWGDYYAHTNYTQDASDDKARIVSEFLNLIQPKITYDFGANDGTYSKLALKFNSQVVAFDIDPVAVERNYQAVKKLNNAMLPLILDLTNPSPAIGFANHERESAGERISRAPDCIMALAVIHHLAISNNLPLDMIAEWLASLSKNLIIEFVPKEDSQVQILLATRRDIFPDYNLESFEEIFGKYFNLIKREGVKNSKRVMYLFERK
ncbi:MAG: hypothetical protein IJQ63_06405 [Synergistaceae bacterium]|nr:hypothetical protein [Synergistaceae bacterium]